MRDLKKSVKMVVLAFGLGFWVAMGVTMGSVSMARMLGVQIPHIMLITDQCDGGPCG